MYPFPQTRNYAKYKQGSSSITAFHTLSNSRSLSLIPFTLTHYFFIWLSVHSPRNTVKNDGWLMKVHQRFRLHMGQVSTDSHQARRYVKRLPFEAYHPLTIFPIQLHLRISCCLHNVKYRTFLLHLSSLTKQE